MGISEQATVSIDQALVPRGQKESEDAVLVVEGLLGLFDSVGGRDQGRRIAPLASTTVAASWQRISERERRETPEQQTAVVANLLREVDTTIAALDIPPEHRRPATVAVLCAYELAPDQARMSIAHLGDSRIYLLRQGSPLQRLTRDHGYFSFAVRRGLLTEEEATRIEQATRAEDLSTEDLLHFQRRNEITCGLGWSDFPHIPTSSQVLLPGDGVLLCTDGVHDNLTDKEIEQCLRTCPERSAHRLVAAAYERSLEHHVRAKRDDISAVVFWYR
jgi:PPM family protein phosphatase